MDKWLHKIKILNRGSSCVNSRKVWFLADSNYQDSSTRELEKHIEKCSLCHKEHQKMKDLNSHIASKIPVEKLDNELNEGLQREIGQLVKNLNLKQNKLYLKKTDWFLTQFFDHALSRKMILAYLFGFSIYLYLKFNSVY